MCYRSISCCFAVLLAVAAGFAQELPPTRPLTTRGDLSAEMVAGIDRFLQQQTARALLEREKLWRRDFSSPGDYDRSIAPKRERLRKLIGAVDPLSPTGTNAGAVNIAETELFTVETISWRVLEGVTGEGLWLKPKGQAVAAIIALPDADQTPELIAGLSPGLSPERQFGRRLAEQGCAVLIPALIDRSDTWSGNPKIQRLTNQPHREWIYRQAFELGRHIIGYEVEKVIAAIDWIEQAMGTNSPKPTPVGAVGYAEGGLLALYVAALDHRLQSVLVSGYFDSRQQLAEEPIYRNVFGLLAEFGDAELATLIAPRALIVEHSQPPRIDGPPKPREGRRGAAPGRLVALDYESVEREIDRAKAFLKPGDPKIFDCLTLISGTEGMATGPGSDRALLALLRPLGVRREQLIAPGPAPVDTRNGFDPAQRQQHQVHELETYTQRVFAQCEAARRDFFWSALTARNAADWESARSPFQNRFWSDTIGRLPAPTPQANPRSRLLPVPSANDNGTNSTQTESKWVGYEVVLDVFPEVFAWGYLLVPKNIKPGERRPVVVCQHGLEGVPGDVINRNPATQAFRYYKAFAARLADDGFVVFAPHNPYRGEDRFRKLQRRANPLGKSLFSVIIAQHQQILSWLGSLPFVDSNRIGFYGLSYGGKTAMRVPAVLEGYSLSICSADFNEWVRKNVSIDFPASYMFGGEYEMPEFDLGHTFNYAEMAGLIAPRPFMVERGRQDGVGIDEWVAEEYSRVRQLYERLKIPERTEIEFFDGPHTINGVGTFQFLKKHLDWPQR